MEKFFFKNQFGNPAEISDKFTEKNYKCQLSGFAEEGLDTELEKIKSRKTAGSMKYLRKYGR